MYFWSYAFSGNLATSKELDKYGKPIAVLEKLKNGKFRATANTLLALKVFIENAGDFTIAEIKRFLEGCGIFSYYNLVENKNLYARIYGDAFDLAKCSFDESKLFKIAEDLRRTDKDETNSDMHTKQLIKLITDLLTFDIQLSNEVSKMKDRSSVYFHIIF